MKVVVYDHQMTPVSVLEVSPDLLNGHGRSLVVPVYEPLPIYPFAERDPMETFRVLHLTVLTCRVRDEYNRRTDFPVLVATHKEDIEYLKRVPSTLLVCQEAPESRADYRRGWVEAMDALWARMYGKRQPKGPAESPLNSRQEVGN